MWLKRFTDYLLKHQGVAFGIVFALPFAPGPSYILALVIVSFITLQKSVVEGAILTAAAVASYLLNIAIDHPSLTEFTILMWVGIAMIVSRGLLTWWLSAMLRRQYNWSAILQFAALMGVLVISVIHLAYPAIADWWEIQLHKQFQLLHEQVKPITKTLMTSVASNKATLVNSLDVSAGMSEEQIQGLKAIKEIFSGLIIALLLFLSVIQLLMARVFQAVCYGVGSVRKELLTIRLNSLAGALFSIGILLAFFENTVAIDVMPVAGLLFFVAGLSVAHYILRQFLLGVSLAWLWVVVFYSVVILFLKASLYVLPMFALFDIGFDLRKRFRKI